MTVKKAQENQVVIPAINIKKFNLMLVGDSALICHAWSEKAKKEMLDKQMKKAKTARQAKNPEQDFYDSLYWLTEKPETPVYDDLFDASFGFPAVAFKSAAVNACSSVSDITKVAARGAFHIVGDMVKINGVPIMREDMVRVGMGTADLRYRGEFTSWSADLEIRYNADLLSLEQIINLFNIAGFAVGIGEWRPQKNGSFGMFHVGGE